MLRTAFAFVAGLFAAMIAITFIELANARLLYPPPQGMDFTDARQVEAFIAAMPTGALALLVLGWCAGAFVGGGVAARIAQQYRTLLALAIGALVAIGVVSNATGIHHPAWVTASGVLLPIPLAWLAATLVRRFDARVG